MPRINFTSSGHLTPVPLDPRIRLSAFDPVIDAQRIAQLEAAMRFIHQRMVLNPCAPCEQAFRALPGGRGFREVWMDPGVWISYTASSMARGFTFPNGRDVVISLSGFGNSPIQWRNVAATLIHELAHVNGASGTDGAAEGVLRQCLFKDHYDPVVIG